MTDDETPKPSPSLWRENHGNLLLTVIGGIFLVGAIILFYNQNKFHKPRFPDSRAIQTATDVSEVNNSAVGNDTDVSILVIGAANSSGTVRIAVYDSIVSFNEPAKAIIKASVSIIDAQATWSIEKSQLPEKFAIATFHDENDDGQLNRNRLGIPTERYGFSRNARGVTGPPSYDQAVLEKSKISESLEISIR